MARVKTFSREEVVEKAMRLFWEKGYESTSLSDLTEHLGIGKGSFYATFSSKEELFNLCIERYTASNIPFLNSALDPNTEFRIGLRRLLEAYVNGLLKDDERKGCFMANSCSLVFGKNSGVGKKIEQHYARIREYFEDHLTRHGVHNDKARAISATIITFLIGASQQSKVDRDTRSYLATVDNIIGLIG